jgi:EmrB/QacA subfamily drug resistance transporter
MQYKWTALTVTTVGTLMAGLDSRILVIGLPTIAKQLHASAEETVWFSQSFLLSSTVALLLIGRFSDLYGKVRIYNIGFIIFTFGSALSSISFDPQELIAFRAVQGIGAAILLANSTAIVTDSSPAKELGTMIGINQTALRSGAMAGLTLSGVILSLTDWRGLFYVNIPIGIFGTVWAYLRLREISKNPEARKIDWMGFVLFSSGLTLFLLAVTYFSYGTGNYTIALIFLIVGAALLATFVRAETKNPSPILDLRLFKIRLFAAGNMAQILNALAWSSLLVLMAFYLQIGLGYTPLEAGLGVLPLEGAYIVSSFISARLSDRYGSRILCTLGLSIITSCFLAMSTFGGATRYEEVALILGIIGIGNGMFTAPNIRAIMGTVPQNRRSIASSFRQTMFNTGSTVSYGLVILFLTLGIPYGTLSTLLQNPGVIGSAQLLFFNGFRVATILLAVIDGLAIIPSVMRGSSRKDEEEEKEIAK